MAKKISIFLLVLGIVFCTVFYITLNLIIPKRVNLIVGQAEEFSYSIPLKATIYDQDYICSSTAQDDEVTENINIDLSSSTSVTALQEGNIVATISALGIPIKDVAINIISPIKLIPSGKIMGIVMNTEGVLVLGTGGIKNEYGEVTNPADGKIKTGDIILACNGVAIDTKEDLISNISSETVDLSIIRNEKELSVKIEPTIDAKGEAKIGAWVRDSTQGLGTITFVNEETMEYGALGHGVYDVDAKVLMPMSDGVATLGEVTGIKKGENGSPGEVKGALVKESEIGTVEKNTEKGVYGELSEFGYDAIVGNQKAVEIATANQVKEGKAVILSDILGDGVKEYDVEIESINKFSLSDKNMVVKITDKNLLDKTGGIIQGLSGSPILQNGKIIGAVTHVFVNDPTKGYGIFIENMLETAERVGE